jgi:hypothetical protein
MFSLLSVAETILMRLRLKELELGVKTAPPK